jgi:DNA modification methylase
LNPVNQILHGSALERLRELDSESVDCCITSPPYWALRDYKTEGQLGLESTFTEYIQRLVQIFSEVKRVLKKSGACWVNLGDTYGGSKEGNTLGTGKGALLNYKDGYANRDFKKPRQSMVPDKSLSLIPERFAIAMVDAGWILRNKIIWYKPNCMPSSAKDRFTVDFEYLYFFTKSARYYFETQYEPMDFAPHKPGNKKIYQDDTGYNRLFAGNALNKTWGTKMPKFGGNKADGYGNPVYSGKQTEPSEYGRIKRCVWKISTKPFSEAHFATFPPELVLTPLLATCPEYVCRKCGKARVTEYERTRDYNLPDRSTYKQQKEGELKWSENPPIPISKSSKLAYRGGGRSRYVIRGVNVDGCNCNAGFDGGICLDPFMGSGTVALVALQNARNFVGIELNKDYITMSNRRLEPYLKQSRLIS